MTSTLFSGKGSRHLSEASYPAGKTAKLSSSEDLTRFSAADFTAIVIPKKHIKQRRKRTAFSNIQLHFLEQFFQKKAYPSSQERNFIGSILNIGSGQVKTWYQNRRTKLKKNKVFDFGIDPQKTPVSGALEGNVNGLVYGNNHPHASASTSNEVGSTAKYFGNMQTYPSTHSEGMCEMHADWTKLTCICSGSLISQQPHMLDEHR